MSIIKDLEKDLIGLYKSCGYELDEVLLVPSSRPDLGQYQLNDAMKLAKIYHKSPIVIAKEIVDKLNADDRFVNVNVAGAGFINVSLSEKFLTEYVNKIKDDISNNVDKKSNKKVIIDYGGANVAKALHVGHLRSANIGEAIKRLARLLGYDIIGDAHLGDSGFNAGATVLEMKLRYPDLVCFKDGYTGEDFDLPIDKDNLNEIYPAGSKKTKEDETLLEEARTIALEIQNNNPKYSVLWNKIKEMSIENIKKTYNRINCTFELLEGEIESFEFIPGMLESLEKDGLLENSEGAQIMYINEADDSKEIPPILLVKSNGAYLYGTTDLGTIVGRMKRFNPDEIWYLADLRQSLHYEQFFRAARKGKFVKEDTVLSFSGFGTVNGSDGKPFKTRDGGIMTLDELIDIVKGEAKKRINTNVVDLDKVEETSEMIAVATLKYADLLPHRATDYIFDPEKFSDLEGKTAPYLLYSTLRIKSLLNKSKEYEINDGEYSIINGTADKDIILTLLDLPVILTRAIENKALNEIAEYIYKLTSVYNKFYAENKILSEENISLRSSWVTLSSIVYKTNLMLLNVLGLECPEKM